MRALLAIATISGLVTIKFRSACVFKLPFFRKLLGFCILEIYFTLH